MKLSIPNNEKESILNELGQANKAFQKIYPGDRPDRQPVHTVYGGADLFSADSAEKMGQAALNTLLNNAPDFVEFARAIELPGYELLPSDAMGKERVIK
jgi:hypothetical protein